MEARTETTPTPLTVQKQHESASPLALEVTQVSPETSRKARRRQRSRDHSVTTPQISQEAPTTPISAPSNPSINGPYDENQLWASEYASSNLHLYDKSISYEYERDESGKIVTVYDEEAGIDRPTVIRSAIQDIEVSEATRELIAARAKLAEISVSTRNGKVISSDNKRAEKLINAERDYHAARLIAAQEFIDAAPGRLKLAQKQALLAEFSVRENGALMGEEANYYLDRQQTVFQRGLERYRGLSRKGKIAAGLGVAAGLAVFGAVAGPTLGLAATGGVVGARFGRGYIKREADRKDQTTLVEKQEASTLRISSEKGYFEAASAFASARSANSLFSTYDDEYSSALADSDNVYLAEGREETKEKRKSLGWAIGGVAIGATLGALIENASDWRGIGRGSRIDLWPFNDADAITGNIDVDLPETDVDVPKPGVDIVEPGDGNFEEYQNLLEERNALLEEKANLLEEHNQLLQEENARLQAELDNSETTPPEVETPDDPTVSAEAEALYGEFAGSTVSIDIPAGSNLWDQLELKVDEQNPYVTFEEKQRLVGNMLSVLQEQNPGRDLSLVYPGEHFEIDLNV